jgi:hypothetical protein
VIGKEPEFCPLTRDNENSPINITAIFFIFLLLSDFRILIVS